MTTTDFEIESINDDGTYKLSAMSYCQEETGGNDFEIMPEGYGKCINFEVYPLPIADFTGVPTEGEKPLTVQFYDESEYGEIYAWNFGDGVTSDLQSPSHEYTQAGDYTVLFTVMNMEGDDSKIRNNYIIVTDAEEIDITDDFNWVPDDATLWTGSYWTADEAAQSSIGLYTYDLDTEEWVDWVLLYKPSKILVDVVNIPEVEIVFGYWYNPSESTYFELEDGENELDIVYPTGSSEYERLGGMYFQNTGDEGHSRVLNIKIIEYTEVE